MATGIIEKDPWLATGSWTSGVDLNTLDQTGIYLCSTSLTNSPDNQTWVYLVTFSKIADGCEQLAFRNGKMWLREKRSNAWSDWRRISTIHRKTYSVTPTASSAVSPFAYFTAYSISSDVSAYGTPVAVTPYGGGTDNPTLIKFNDSLSAVLVYSMKNYSVPFEVLFEMY